MKYLYPRIEKRLELILEKTPHCDIISDIGCDHAYISIHLIKKGITKKVYACDIRKGPLEIAKKNIAKYNCQNQIQTILANGLDGVIHKHVNAHIIAGMGGEMICEIINKYIDKISFDTVFILQPMSRIEVLREYLYKNNFLITDEKLCKEDKRIYNVVCAKKSIEKHTVDDEIYYIIGKKLIENKDKLLFSLVKKRINEYENIKKGLIQAGDTQNCDKTKHVDFQINKLKKIMEEIL